MLIGLKNNARLFSVKSLGSARSTAYTIDECDNVNVNRMIRSSKSFFLILVYIVTRAKGFLLKI